jgi:hypothetical protein
MVVDHVHHLRGHGDMRKAGPGETGPALLKK